MRRLIAVEILGLAFFDESRVRLSLCSALFSFTLFPLDLRGMNMPAFRMFRAVLSCALLLSAANVFAASPRLSLILPRGGQRGQEVEFTFSGSVLTDAEEVMFYSPGFQLKKIEPVNGNAFKATIAIAADAQLGEHVCQVRTKSGVSDFRTFYVGYLPDAAEVEPNNEFEAPQAIPMNVTVSGIANNEDVDYYVVEAKKGDRIAVEVEGMRLGTTQFDPYVAILDSKRFELASADDSPLLIQDCLATAVAPEDGKYIIEVRESSYAGNGNCRYRMHVGNFPRPTAVYPAGGKLGDEIEVKFIGDAAGNFTQKYKLPAEQIDEYGLVAGADASLSPSPNTFRLSAVGNTLEVEPNNDLATATPSEFPTAFNGILQQAGDQDFFKFTATKGQQFDVECFGRRVRSPIDPVMYLYDASGRGIASNDDSRGPDSYFRFNVPADGEYTLMVRDHLQRGGADYVYRVEFLPIQPSLTLSIPRVERYGQYRQQVFVARGNRFATTINLARQNFGGELVLAPPQLPEGVTLHHDKVPANMSVMPVVFEAAQAAPLGGGLFDFPAHLAENAEVRGGFSNTSDFIIGAPGQSRYYTKTVNRLPIVVVDELPFKINLVTPKVPIARNGSMQMKIVVEKKEGWDENVVIQFPFRPPGISAGSSITIPKGQNEGLYPVNANGNAAVGLWKVIAIGWANVGGNAFSASELTPLEISEPYLNLTLNRAATEQGQPTEIACKVEIGKEFDGAATVQLIGLPNKAVAEPVEIKKDSQEVIFKVNTDMTTPAGRHQNIFAQVTIPMNGETVVHNTGNTELRVDVPLPPKVDEPKPAPAAAPAVAAAKPAEPVAKPERRLTRLEMLRLEKAKKAGAAGGE